MRLFNAEFVGRLRKSCRLVIKADPQMRAEARRYGPRFWTRHRNTSSLRWLLSLVFAGMTAILPSWNAAVYMLSGWALVLALVCTHQFQKYYGLTAPILVGLPITSQQILEKGVGQCLRSSFWLLVDSLAMVGAIFWFKADSSNAWWGIIPAAILVWASALATSVILMGLRPRFPYGSYAIAAYVVAMLAHLGLSAIGTLKAPLLDYIATGLLWATPPGWACQVSAWLLGVHRFPVVPAGLLVFSLALAVPAYRAFQQHFWTWEADETGLAATVSKEMTDEELENAAEYDEASPMISRASEVEELVLRGDFLMPFASRQDCPQGWMERWILARFPGRRALLDFLLGANPAWSATYLFGWICLGIGSGLGWLAGRWSPALTMPILSLTMFVAIACTTPLFGGLWAGLQLGILGNRHLAFIALLPIRLHDVSRTILAVNMVRCLFALPCWVACFLALSYFQQEPASRGMLVGVECWLIALLLQPFFLIFKYSPGTNDTSSGCLTVLMFLGACLLPIAAAVTALFMVFTPASPVAQGFAFATLAITSFGLERFYHWLYTSKRLDLLAKRA